MAYFPFNILLCLICWYHSRQFHISKQVRWFCTSSLRDFVDFHHQSQKMKFFKNVVKSWSYPIFFYALETFMGSWYYLFTMDKIECPTKLFRPGAFFWWASNRRDDVFLYFLCILESMLHIFNFPGGGKPLHLDCQIFWNPTAYISNIFWKYLWLCNVVGWIISPQRYLCPNPHKLWMLLNMAKGIYRCN